MTTRTGALLERTTTRPSLGEIVEQLKELLHTPYFTQRAEPGHTQGGELLTHAELLRAEGDIHAAELTVATGKDEGHLPISGDERRETAAENLMMAWVLGKRFDYSLMFRVELKEAMREVITERLNEM